MFQSRTNAATCTYVILYSSLRGVKRPDEFLADLGAGVVEGVKDDRCRID